MALSGHQEREDREVETGWMAFADCRDTMDVMEEMVLMVYQGRLDEVDEISHDNRDHIFRFADSIQGSAVRGYFFQRLSKSTYRTSCLVLTDTSNFRFHASSSARP